MMKTNKLCLLRLCATLVSANAIAVPGTAAPQTCEGDCNGDRSVAVDEIILGVRIALGEAPIGDCQAMDGDGDSAVTVNELLAGRHVGYVRGQGLLMWCALTLTLGTSLLPTRETTASKRSVSRGGSS